MQQQPARGLHGAEALATRERHRLDRGYRAIIPRRHRQLDQQRRKLREPGRHPRRHAVAVTRGKRRDQRLRSHPRKRSRFDRVPVPGRRARELRLSRHRRHQRPHQRFACRRRHQRDVAAAETWHRLQEQAEQLRRKGRAAIGPGRELVGIAERQPGGRRHPVDLLRSGRAQGFGKVAQRRPCFRGRSAHCTCRFATRFVGAPRRHSPHRSDGASFAASRSAGARSVPVRFRERHRAADRKRPPVLRPPREHGRRQRAGRSRRR